MDLTQLYTAYIAQINAGCDPGALAKFVKDGVVHNDSPPMSVNTYAQNIIDSQVAFPELHFEVEMLVTESAKGEKAAAGDGTIAARIKLSYKGSLVGTNSPSETTSLQTSKEVFYEHVFYQLEGGKISRVWSLLDGAGQKWKENRAGGD